MYKLFQIVLLTLTLLMPQLAQANNCENHKSRSHCKSKSKNQCPDNKPKKFKLEDFAGKYAGYSNAVAGESGQPGAARTNIILVEIDKHGNGKSIFYSSSLFKGLDQLVSHNTPDGTAPTIHFKVFLTDDVHGCGYIVRQDPLHPGNEIIDDFVIIVQKGKLKKIVTNYIGNFGKNPQPVDGTHFGVFEKWEN